MKSGSRFLLASFILTLGLGTRETAHAQHPSLAAIAAAKSATASSEHPKSKLDLVTEGMKTAGETNGLFKMWYNDQRLLILIKSSDLDKEFIVLTTIAKGISRNDVIGGMYLGFDDDVILGLQESRRQPARRAAQCPLPRQCGHSRSRRRIDGLQRQRALLAAHRHRCRRRARGRLHPRLHERRPDDRPFDRRSGPPFHFVSDRSTWAKVKVFKDNAELRVAAVYSGMQNLQTVIDPRGAQIQVHYGISRLPSTDYKPRKADDRVGYFLTVRKNFSRQGRRPALRPLHQPLGPAEGIRRTKCHLGPGEADHVLYRKHRPQDLRPYVARGHPRVEQGLREAGLLQRDRRRAAGDYETYKEDIDPEDINYNMFRWITAEAGFAMGPSRVNPEDGRNPRRRHHLRRRLPAVLEAGIRGVDAADAGRAVRPLQRQAGRRQEADRRSPSAARTRRRLSLHVLPRHAAPDGLCRLGADGQRATDDKGKLPDEFVHQALKEIVMHEVGHTLGLRHNFKASTVRPRGDQRQDRDHRERRRPSASVMDYARPTSRRKGVSRATTSLPTIGPYDYWAIEYGYKDISATNRRRSAKIAARSAEPALQYATDEDMFFGIATRWSICSTWARSDRFRQSPDEAEPS